MDSYWYPPSYHHDSSHQVVSNERFDAATAIRRYRNDDSIARFDAMDVPRQASCARFDAGNETMQTPIESSFAQMDASFSRLGASFAYLDGELQASSAAIETSIVNLQSLSGFVTQSCRGYYDVASQFGAAVVANEADVVGAADIVDCSKSMTHENEVFEKMSDSDSGALSSPLHLIAQTAIISTRLTPVPSSYPVPLVIGVANDFLVDGNGDAVIDDDLGVAVKFEEEAEDESDFVMVQEDEGSGKALKVFDDIPVSHVSVEKSDVHTNLDGWPFLQSEVITQQLTSLAHAGEGDESGDYGDMFRMTGISVVCDTNGVNCDRFRRTGIGVVCDEIIVKGEVKAELQHSRRMPINQQAVRHSENAVVWAPVRSQNKMDATDDTNPKTEVVEGVSALKNDHQVQTGNKRAEMERYVPKHVAKEMAYQGSTQPVAVHQTATNENKKGVVFGPHDPENSQPSVAAVGKTGLAIDSRNASN